MDAVNLIRVALAIPGIKSADFSGRPNISTDYITGVVYDEETGQEYDVVKETKNSSWRVNDDFGRNHVGMSLKQAVLRARAANKA